MITQDLHAVDLDANWTPNGCQNAEPGGMDSTWTPHNLGLSRAVATNLHGPLEETTAEVFPIRTMPRCDPAIWCGPNSGDLDVPQL